MVITKISRRIAAFSLATVVCAGPAQAAINAGDRLNIHVYNHPELSTIATVDSRGVIQLPVVGTVRAQGFESKDVAYVIRQRIQPYVPFPAVDVQDTSESQTLFVSGAPGGVYPYSPNETLTAAVAEITKATQFVNATPSQTAPVTQINPFDHSRLDLKRVTVYRGGHALGTYDLVALRDSGDPGPTLFANDTVAFTNKPIQISVVGAVNTPGSAYLWPNEPLSDAIAQVGGVSPVAATSHVELTRENQPPQMLAFGDAAFNNAAQPGDVITVPTAPRVTVTGLVEKPGPVTLVTDFTLLSALASAGGYNQYGDLRKVQVVHQGVVTKYNIVKLAHGDMSQNPTLSDGDSVFVPEGYKTNWSLVWQALGSITGGYYNIYRSAW